MNRNKLLGRAHEMGYNITSLAKAIEMPLSTFRYKLKHGKLGSDDIKSLMIVLEIDDPVPYFFA